MKGIIFNVVEEVVALAFGPDVWDSLLDEAKLDGIYTSLGSYPDEELLSLVSVASSKTGIAQPDLLHVIGQQAIPRLHLRFPIFFDRAPSARAFILSLNTIIHPEVRKLYAGAGCPYFHFKQADTSITLGYDSPRKLCFLATGFVAGLASYYNEPITSCQTACMHRGDPTCQIELNWQ